MKKIKTPKKIHDKKKFKHLCKKCGICNEKDYSVLDVHRIIPKHLGGGYTEDNCICLCTKCHRLYHCKNPKINNIRKTLSTGGEVVIWKDENGKEHTNLI